MYCIIKCIVQGKQARVCKKRRFASSVLHSCNVRTQICVTRPQCVKKTWAEIKTDSKNRVSWRILVEALCSVAE